MSNIYNEEYLEGTMAVLKDNIDELGKWDAYNDDILNEDIHFLKAAYALIELKLKDRVEIKEEAIEQKPIDINW